MLNFFKKPKEPEPNIFNFFVYNKMTFPIKNNVTFSHANLEDIDYLKNSISSLSCEYIPHKKYNEMVYLLRQHIGETVLLVYFIDEAMVDTDLEICTILIELMNSKKSDFINQTENLITIDFKNKKRIDKYTNSDV